MTYEIEYSPYIDARVIEARKGWQYEGLCANSDTPEDWEVRPTDVIFPGYEPRALELCEGCPVFAECARFAANPLRGYSEKRSTDEKPRTSDIRLSDYIFAGLCFPMSEDVYEISTRHWEYWYRERFVRLAKKGSFNRDMQRTLDKHRKENGSHKKFVEEKEGNETRCH